MFKPSAYSEIQKRKKIIIGMHLVELTDRYHYLNIAATPNNNKQKKTSFSQYSRQDYFVQKQMATLPVTPNTKCQSFLESSRLLVSKQINITPRAQIFKQKTKPKFPNLQTQTIERRDNLFLSFKEQNVKEQKQRNNIEESKKAHFEHTFQSDQEDFIDYVCNKRII